MLDKNGHLVNGEGIVKRDKNQYFQDIATCQEIEDEIAFRFAVMQGDGVKPASSRRTLEDLSKVKVTPDYIFDKLGLVEVKFTRKWHNEIGFKSYQLRKYAVVGAKILYVNGWFEKTVRFATQDGGLIDPAWILENGTEPSERIKNLFVPKGAATGKLDISLWADQLEWHQLP